MKIIFTAIATILLLANIPLFAQKLSSVKIYTLQNDEKIIFENENILFSSLNKSNHLMFTQKDSVFYIIFNSKRFGPFDFVIEHESAGSILDWAVKKDNKWYQVFLDKDLLLGPYDEVTDVYRDETGEHYGFRARIDSSWYAIIDNKKHGPYFDMSQGYPRFSSKGGNWMIKVMSDKESKSKLITKYGEVPSSLELDEYAIFLTESGYDYFQYQYSAYGGSWAHFQNFNAAENYYEYNNFNAKGINYHMRGSIEDQPFEKRFSDSLTMVNLDRDNMHVIKFGQYNKATVLSTGKVVVKDSRGNTSGPFNNCFDFKSSNGNFMYSAENYFVKENGMWKPIYTNQNENDKVYLNSLHEINVKKESFFIFNDKKYGPFNNVEKYDNQISRNGHFIALVNDDKRLFLDGIATAIKNVKSVKLDEETGNCFTMTDDNSCWLNNTYLGKFNLKSVWSDVQFAADGKSCSFLFSEGEKYYIFNTALNKKFGPFNDLSESTEWILTPDGKHIGYVNSNGFFIDGKRVAASGVFSIDFSKNNYSFLSLRLKGRDLYKESYSLDNLK